MERRGFLKKLSLAFAVIPAIFLTNKKANAANEVHVVPVLGPCEDCLYYHFTGQPPDDLNGSCRKYPPQWLSGAACQISDWPLVKKDDWCGEFVSKKGQTQKRIS